MFFKPIQGLVSRLIFTLFLILILGCLSPETALAATVDRPILTVELLQERLKLPEQNNGNQTIDLKHLEIDLRSENSEFRDRFYSLLQARLTRSSHVSLDLSDSIVKGSFDGSLLALRVPLYGQALSPLFTPEELEQLQRDRRRISQLRSLSRLILDESQLNNVSNLKLAVFRSGLILKNTRFLDSVNFNNIFFLDRVEAQGAIFSRDADWSETRFSQPFSLTDASFGAIARFRNSIFFDQSNFARVHFKGDAIFIGSTFENTVNFHQAQFDSAANFTRTHWKGNADLSQTHWQDRAQFSKSDFDRALFLSEATFLSNITFRESLFSQPVNLRGANIWGLMDFSDTRFSHSAYLNIAELNFDSDRATITGNPGQIGKILSIPTLQGNENLLQNLVRNFRIQEQIADANQIEYQIARLWQQELGDRFRGIDINTAHPETLAKIGFSPQQVTAILNYRKQQPFVNSNEILNLDEIDLATYIKVRDRLVFRLPISLFGWFDMGLDWLGLSLLLWLSCYGTNFGLVFGIGLLTIAYFSGLFWWIDRDRQYLPHQTLPHLGESLWMLGSFIILSTFGLLAIFRNSAQPWLTLLCLAAILVPLPTCFLGSLYRRKFESESFELSYFVEEGTLRQLRLAIGRLPIVPRYPLFRERYLPLLLDRRWNWLNYYDFSLNNLFKFGFNDIRLRDTHLPGEIASLVWYQWILGLLYITLLFWTLSRTIPGLNLLIYLK
ncbi:MAG TPA: pentapeptide repeat-containing protein [Oscillatoriales cyanobacterium M59_W2019_021]|nr:pentapeptide repeat-containing protein [Oscillatoriales cyanobacterium M4454_W2019_049]HIK52560.1 pentapeptide repeat-containing protein [Oscillatoriales cyanobacterium M59_W2019_021]